MEYLLMNYTYEVAVLDIDVNKFNELHPEDIVKHVDIIDRLRAPFEMRSTPPALMPVVMSKWLCRRLMPINRENGCNIELNKAIGENRLESSLKAYGTNLTDGFWLKPINGRKKWKDINFFTNDFSYDIGNYIMGVKKKKPDLMSPDLTTNGNMPKTWRIIGDKRYLFKGGAAPDFEEPCNEIFISKLLGHITKLPFVKYQGVKEGNTLFSVCKSFIKEGVEFVPAVDIYNSFEKPLHLSPNEHMVQCCKKFGIIGAREYISNMRALDYIINNNDRHLGNWGFLYDVDNCNFIGPAPLFDCGSSLWPANKSINLTDEPQEELERLAADQLKDVENRVTYVDKSFIMDDAALIQMLLEAYELANICPGKDRITQMARNIRGRCSVIDRYLEISEERIARREELEGADRELEIGLLDR